MLQLELLPAEQGDSLWLEWGEGKTRRILAVDGGPLRLAAAGGPTSALRQRIEAELAARGGQLHLDLLVASHIDNDHIEGVLELLENPPANLSFGDIWFNAHRHLLPPDQLGSVEGERLSRQIETRPLPWNREFGGGPAIVPAAGPNTLTLPGGLHITLLSPTSTKLAILAKTWKAEIHAMGLDGRGRPPAEVPKDRLGHHDSWPPDLDSLVRQRPLQDSSRPNGSSIALLVEYDEGAAPLALLLTADSHAPVLEASLRQLLEARGIAKLHLDACQVPHHGSKANISNEFLKRLDCKRFLVSSSGIGRSGHPDAESIARLVKYGGSRPELCFNYRSELTLRWQQRLSRAPDYSTRYPEPGRAGITLTFP